MPRESGPDEYPNFPEPPEAPLIPPNPNKTVDNLYDATVLMISYMKRVEVFLARLHPFVGDFKRLDGLQNAQAGLQDMIEQSKELIAIDDGRIKSLEAEIANIKQKLSVIEFHVRRENFGTIQLEEPTEE